MASGENGAKFLWTTSPPWAAALLATSAALFFATAARAPAAPSPAGVETMAATFYVSPQGSDRWSGRRSRRNSAGTDGPLASLTGARDAVRRWKAAGGAGPVTVRVASGVYTLTEPFVLEPQDSGSPDAPVTYEGDVANPPILSGGRELPRFRQVGRLWQTVVPRTEPGALAHEITALWVNGQRRTLARTPNEGHYFTIAGAPLPGSGDAANPNRAFRFHPGDIKEWPDLQDVRVVVFHNWETSIHHIQSVDPATNTVVFTGPAVWPLQEGSRRYYVENTPEALDAPGEWYFDRHTQVLSYIPLKGERIASARATAPVLSQLILLKGGPAQGRFVENVHFANLRLYYTGYVIEPQGHSDGQAAVSVPATFDATGARRCSITGCEIAHTGNYAVALRAGSTDNRIARNELHDLGAGGIRIGETGDPPTPQEAVERNTVDSNFLHDYGQIFRGGVGVILFRTSYNTVSHNDIGDGNYTGISVGWSWGYAPSSANHNVLEYNHIHDIGRGVLSDMGAIYTLGVSPGTIERGNVMHDIYCYPGGYGGWGVYTDEGSSDILVENNLVFNTSSGCFHQHYGENNVLRNNIFAFGVTGVLQRTREETHNSFTFERNIVVANGSPFQVAGWSNGYYTIDHNLYWNYADPHPSFFGMSLAEWQAKGRDVHSLLANPDFLGRKPVPGDRVLHGATREDFRLAADTPARQVGFVPFSTEKAGLYGDAGWASRPERVKRSRYYPPPPAPPRPIAEGFEETPVGATAEGATTNEEPGKGDSIRVTDETAASGRHSLKFVDAPGLEHQYNPHLFYTTDWSSGTLREDLDLRVEAGCIAYHEWRDSANPYHVGPGFRVTADGQILAGGKLIAHYPPGQWFHLTLWGRLGQNANGTFDIAVSLPGKAPEVFRNLPCDPAFHSLNWFGFSMDGDQHSVMYVDNLHLAPAS